MPPFIDLTGKRFGRLVVKSRIFTASKQPKWLCECDCGTQREVFGNSLRSGATTSCVCFRIEQVTQHGLSHKAPEYAVWNSMIHRCTNPKMDSYPDYGGRGIKVCERWRNSFEAFLADMGPRPSKKHSIERKDANGDYEPNNCVWATAIEQGRNKRNNHFLIVRGEKLTFSECLRRFGVARTTLRKRLNSGMSDEDAVLTPDRRRLKRA